MPSKQFSAVKKTVAILAVLAQLLFAAGARAAALTDFVDLNNHFNYYSERLNNQKNTLKPSLDYVRGVLAKFDAQAAKLTKRAASLRSAAARAQARLSNNELDVCTVTFRGRQISISDAYSIAKDAEKKAQLCQKYKAEAMLDERTLSDRMKEIDRIAGELAEWKKENDSAVTDAMMLVIEQIVGKFAACLSKESASLKRLKEAVERREKSLSNVIDAGGEIKALKEVSRKLDDALEKYTVAWTKATAGAAYRKTEPFTLWSLFQSEASFIAQAEAQASDQVKAVLEDPAYSEQIQKALPAAAGVLDIIGQKGIETVLEKEKLGAIFSSVKGTAKLVPAVGITVLIRDSSYTGLKWWLSLEQVTSRFDIADGSAKATKSLIALVEKRKPKWNSVLED
jgi:hypothetical protein